VLGAWTTVWRAEAQELDSRDRIELMPFQMPERLRVLQQDQVGPLKLGRARNKCDCCKVHAIAEPFPREDRPDLFQCPRRQGFRRTPLATKALTAAPHLRFPVQ